MTAPARTSHPHRWLILALVLCAECMDLLDSTIVNVAAPTLAADLRASTAALQWVIGGYALTFAVGLIAGARLGDVYGRRRLFVLGALGFAVTSLSCALAVDPGMLMASRLAQGATAALLIPQGLGIIRETFAPQDQAAAFGLFGPVIGLSAVLGPILGGVLVDADVFGTGWRLIFLINVPLGLAAALGAARVMPAYRIPDPPRLDGVGTAIGAVAMGLLVYPLIQGREAGWPLWAYLMLAGSAVAFGVLVLWLRRVRRSGRDPLVDAGIFAHRGYSAGLASVLAFFTGTTGLLLVVTLFLQFGAGFSAVHAGLTIGPLAAGMVVGAVVAAAVVVPRMGRTGLQLAVLVQAGGIWWLHQAIAAHGLGIGTADLAGPEVLVGIGIGMVVAPLFDIVLAAVDDAEVGSASGVLNAGQQLAGAVGVAVLGTVFFSAVASDGFVVAATRCLLVELGTLPVLLVLVSLLPRRARGEQPAAPEPDPALAR